MPNIKDARIPMLATDGFEQSEFMVLRGLALPEGRPIRGWNKTDGGEMEKSDLRIADADPSQYSALVLPGGALNPDKLRVYEPAMKIVESFLSSGKIVAAICHAPWLLVQADAVRGRRVTSFKSIR